MGGILAAVGSTLYAVSEQDIRNVLKEKGIVVAPEILQRASVQGLLSVVDPHAVISSSNTVPLPPDLRPDIGAEEAWSEGIRYLQVNHLYRDDVSAWIDRLEKWFVPETSGLILDLRAAAGTSFYAVDRLAALFVDGGVALYEIRTPDGHVKEIRTVPGDASATCRFPVMVLVDGNTSGTSEILASVLKGKARIMLVGETTQGDGLVRETIPLPNGEFLHLATRRVAPAGGDVLHGAGVVPDLTLNDIRSAGIYSLLPTVTRFDREQSEKSKQDRVLMERVSGDVPLQRVTDILLGLKALERRQNIFAAEPEKHAVKSTAPAP